MKTIVAAHIISLCSALAAQQFSSVPGQGRSMVVTKLGIVAAPQFLASQPVRTFWNRAATPWTRQLPQTR